jgi:hypothetical protein
VLDARGDERVPGGQRRGAQDLGDLGRHLAKAFVRTTGIDGYKVACRFREDAILGMARASASAARRVNGLDEREPVEVGIAGVDGADAVLAHEYCRVRIVDDVPGEVRQLIEDLGHHVTVSLGRHQHRE